MDQLTITKEEFNTIFRNIDEKKIQMLSKNIIEKRKKQILEDVLYDENELDLYLEKLELYRFVDEIDEINLGSYIRWFNIKTVELSKLTNGGFIIDIKYQNNNIILVCKNTMNRIFSLKLEECIIFQKLSKQEELIIEILDYIGS